MEYPQKSVEAWFHDRLFAIEMTADANNLKISVEEKLTCKFWYSKYSSSYLEELTKKTSSFKPYKVFLTMLAKGLEESSQSIILDLLHSRELESLRNSSSHSDKLYLILTYVSEFDKIHYPLPLAYQESPSKEMLISLVHRLRAEINSVKQGLDPSQIEKSALIKENQELRALVGDCEHLKQRNIILEEELESFKLEKEKEIERLSILNEGMEEELFRVKEQMSSIISHLEREQELVLEIESLRKERDHFHTLSEDLFQQVQTATKEANHSKKQVSKLKSEFKNYNAPRTISPKKHKSGVEIEEIENKLDKIHHLLANSMS